MLTYNEGIYKQILAPIGVVYYLSKEVNYYIKPSTRQTCWEFLFPEDLRNQIGLTDGMYSAINQGESDRKNSTDGARERIKKVLSLENCPYYSDLEEHLKEMFRDNAAISLYLNKKGKNLKFYNLGQNELEAFIRENEDDVEKDYTRLLSLLHDGLIENWDQVKDDKRFSETLRSEMKEHIEDDPIKVLIFLCIGSIFAKDENKESFAAIEKHFLNKEAKSRENKEQKKTSDEIISFGTDLLNNTEYLLNKWEQSQDHAIDKDLLASCTVKGKDFESLYEYFKEAVKNDIDRNCVVQATGGSGKTFSLVYTCKQFLIENKEVIPVFIQMRKVDPARVSPISSYIYSNYINRIEYDTPTELVEQFITHVSVFLKESKKHLLVVLDGCNECPGAALSDLDKIVSLPNTIVVASSRLKDANMEDYYTIRLHSLDSKSTRKYLDKFNLMSDSNLYPDNLRLPIFVYMYVQICRENMDSQERLSSLLNQATLINDWITSDLNKYLRSHADRNNDISFVIEYLLPLLAINIYFRLDHKEHTSLAVKMNVYLDAVKEVMKIFEDDDFSTNLLLKKDIDVSEYTKKRCIQLVSDVAVSRFGFMQRDEGEDTVFSWTHECYRDWFIAKGLDVIRHYSKSLSDKYIKELIYDTFRYPRVFTDYKDYPSYYVALYYAELIGRDTLTSINDPLYHSLIRNIVFFADDLGDTDNVVEYSDYLSKRDMNPNIETSPIDKARAFSGTAYSLMHIYNLEERTDCDQIVDNSFYMLEEARKNSESVLGFELKPDDGITEENILDTPDKVRQYLDDYVERIDEKAKTSTLWDTNELGEVMALYARIFGNYGSYYLFVFHKNGDKKELLNAYRTHLLGAAVKNYLTCRDISGREMAGSSSDHAMAISYGSLGTDMYRLQKYVQAVEFFKYSAEQFNVPDYFVMNAKIHIMRSQVADLYNNEETGMIPDMVDMAKAVVTFFKDNRLVGRLERLSSVVADLVTFCREHPVSEEVERKISDLIDHIDRVYVDMSIYDNYKADMIDYWKHDGENKWNKYFD